MTSPRVVMVVDDDEDLRETVREFLEEDGYRTICSSDGASALSSLNEQSEMPAVILLDLMMPGMNGWQFREEQLRRPQVAHIPVVVMTASRDASGIDANEIVYKPVTLARLLELVRRYTANDEPNGPGGGTGSAGDPGRSGDETRPARNDFENSRYPAITPVRKPLPYPRPAMPPAIMPPAIAPAHGMTLGFAADAP